MGETQLTEYTVHHHFIHFPDSRKMIRLRCKVCKLFICVTMLFLTYQGADPGRRPDKICDGLDHGLDGGKYLDCGSASNSQKWRELLLWNGHVHTRSQGARLFSLQAVHSYPSAHCAKSCP